MNTESKNDNNWPLAQLKPFLQEAWQEVGYKSPTLIQERAVPIVLEGKDLVAESPTGTGKTVAYLIPLLQKIDPEKKGLQVVILAPSHELAMQISQTIQTWAKGSDIVSASLIGSANIKRQVENLKKHPQIIVATTGRLLELIKMKKVKMHEVKTIVVDEFDVLIAQEHVDNLKSIIKTTLKDRQILFFSATLSERTDQIAKELMKDPITVKIEKEAYGESNTEHLYVVCEQRDKVEALAKIINSGKMKALAFVNDINKISEIEGKLKFKGIELGVLIGESTKQERKESLDKFRLGRIPLLIATDVASRGLDIDKLTHVINLDLPRNFDQYTHRAGRTGRMGASGTVISIVTQGEESVLKKITNKTGVTVKKKKLYGGKILDPNQKI